MQYLSSSDWLISLSIMVSKFTCKRLKHFLLFKVLIILHCICMCICNFFLCILHLFNDGHLDCYHFLAIVNNTQYYYLFGILVLWINNQNWNLLDHMVVLVLIFGISSYYYTLWLHHFKFLSAVYKELLSLHIFRNICFLLPV